jgi:hypothetical protein
MTPRSTVEVAMRWIVLYASCPDVSSDDGEPPARCFDGSSFVSTGLMTSQLCPRSLLRKTTSAAV